MIDSDANSLRSRYGLKIFDPIENFKVEKMYRSQFHLSTALQLSQAQACYDTLCHTSLRWAHRQWLRIHTTNKLTIYIGWQRERRWIAILPPIEWKWQIVNGSGEMADKKQIRSNVAPNERTKIHNSDHVWATTLPGASTN